MLLVPQHQNRLMPIVTGGPCSPKGESGPYPSNLQELICLPPSSLDLASNSKFWPLLNFPLPYTWSTGLV